MESTLFTELTTNEEANLSGGSYWQPVGDITTNVGIQVGYGSQQNQVVGNDNYVYQSNKSYKKSRKGWG